MPFIAYVAITVAAFRLRTNTVTALFVVAGATLGMLFIGIHNAWDSVTHIVVAGRHTDATKPE